MEESSINVEFEAPIANLPLHDSTKEIDGIKLINQSNQIAKDSKFVSISQSHISAQMISEVQKKTFLCSQEPADLNCLIKTDRLNDIIKNDPWKISIQQTLANFQKRMYSNSEMKFRIGGRIIHSASQIVRAKSNLVIQESHDTQDELLIKEVDEEIFEDFDDSDEGIMNDPNIDSLNQILGVIGANQSLSDNSTIFFDDDQIKNYVLERDAEVDATISPHAYYSVDRDGRRFLASPVRKIFRKIELGDLGKALIKTLNYQLRSPRKNHSKLNSKCLASKILNENLLKKAEEERALVELQITRMHDHILNLYSPGEPIAFLKLIINPDPDGIVRTLLYLLQLVNRKFVELWQKVDEEDNKEENNVGLNIFVAPRETKEK